MKKYKLSFLPLFEGDLNEIVDYISTDLQNLSAADHLIHDIESAINKRLEAPLSFAPYPSSKNGHTHITESTSETFLFSML